MKNFTSFMGALLAIFVLNACDNEVPEQVNDQLEKNGREYIFTIKNYEWDEENDSRTQLSLGSTGIDFAWANGDTIGILPDEGSQVYFAIDPKDAGKDKASFNGGAWKLKPGSEYAAYFPFVQDIMLDRTNVPVDYSGQELAGRTLANMGNFDYMAAKPSGADPTTGALGFEFNHLGVVVALDFNVPTPRKIKQLILTADLKPVFPVTGKIDLTQDPIAISHNEEDLSRTLYIDAKDLETTAENESVTVYFMMPPVDLTNEKLSMTVISEEGNIRYSLSGKNLRAGRATILSTNLLPDDQGFSYLYSAFPSALTKQLQQLGGTKIKFVANSTVTSENYFYWNGTQVYAVRNGEWLEIHTAAKEFYAYNWGLSFDGSLDLKYKLLTEIDLTDVNNVSSTNFNYL